MGWDHLMDRRELLPGSLRQEPVGSRGECIGAGGARPDSGTLSPGLNGTLTLTPRAAASLNSLSSWALEKHAELVDPFLKPGRWPPWYKLGYQTQDFWLLCWFPPSGPLQCQVLLREQPHEKLVIK